MIVTHEFARWQHATSWPPGADTGFPEKKGRGCEDIHKHPPPLDIVRVTSSALQKKWKIHPLLDIHKHPPPLDIARVTSSTFQGGGVIGPGHAQFA